MAYDPNEVRLQILTITGPFSLAEKAVSISILNYGAATGTVDGEVLAIGASINLQLQPPMVLPRLDMDGTGTTFLVVAAYVKR